jgi:crotonobetainyl-CoA:carnitine CoA-transferase CaiB-like acyl-CoA transferase
MEAKKDHSPAKQTDPIPSTGLPLSGFRIVELTVAWAGPMVGRILANLGAEVIHIESASNLDS